MTRNLTCLWILVAVLGLLISPAYAQLLTLNGELIASTSAQGSIGCVNNQQTATFTFSGNAAGPYPGTFTEQFTLTPTSSGLVDLKADFTIISGDVTITGEKTREIFFPCDSTTYSTAMNMNYTATISGPSGTLEDAGIARTVFHVLAGNATGISEAFSVGEPATLTLAPETDINPVGTSHTVTATVENVLMGPVSGAQVCFFVNGSVETQITGSCTTNASGECNFTYGGPLLPGADVIEAYVNQQGSNCPGTNPLLNFPVAEATKAWIFTTPPAGSVTGGGQAGPTEITFGFNARTDPKVNGNCNVIDRSTDPRTMIKCTSVTSVTVIPSPTGGGTAHIDATGTINGIQTGIQIDVMDISEPNRGADQFRISTTSGYTAGGAVTQGNIQVHR